MYFLESSSACFLHIANFYFRKKKYVILRNNLKMNYDNSYDHLKPNLPVPKLTITKPDNGYDLKPYLN
jgi:hypothetical protein